MSKVNFLRKYQGGLALGLGPIGLWVNVTLILQSAYLGEGEEGNQFRRHVRRMEWFAMMNAQC